MDNFFFFGAYNNQTVRQVCEHTVFSPGLHIRHLGKSHYVGFELDVEVWGGENWQRVRVMGVWAKGEVINM